MPTVLTRAFRRWPNRHRFATGTAFAGVVLVIIPLLARFGQAPLLTEAGHWVAFTYGAALMTCGIAALVRDHNRSARWERTKGGSDVS